MTTVTPKPLAEVGLPEPIVLRPEDLARVAAAGGAGAPAIVPGKVTIMGGLRDPSAA
jgi:hypothetical protein